MIATATAKANAKANAKTNAKAKAKSKVGVLYLAHIHPQVMQLSPHGRVVHNAILTPLNVDFKDVDGASLATINGHRAM